MPSKRLLIVKWLIGIVLVALVLGAGALVFLRGLEEAPPPQAPKTAIIGSSVEGRSIAAHTFGSGETHLVFVGGIHGGYEWNSVLLAYEFLDYLTEDSARVPEGLSVTVITSLNPDGVYKVIGKEGHFTAADAPPSEETVPGRFNARGVDLNRNFDCKWQAESTWRGAPVSAGTAAFSEPEARALRDLVLRQKPDAVIFWHSQANAVYASECEDGILPETLEIARAYARAAGYPAVSSFDEYAVTGDAEGWLASIGIPAITVELSTHEVIEWEKNLKGIQALLEFYGAAR